MRHNVWVRSKNGSSLSASGHEWLNRYSWHRHTREESELEAEREATHLRLVARARVIVARDGLWPNSQIGEGPITFTDEATQVVCA